MQHITILSASVRNGRKSHRVAKYFERYIHDHALAHCSILDLNEYQFPVFEERLRFHPSPTPAMLEYAQRIKETDGVLIVTPEYNGGYPAALKNAIDLLYDEWHRKPVAISTVSDGQFGGTQVITSIQFSLWKMRAWTVPAMFPVPKVDELLNEDGTPPDRESIDKRAHKFLGELLWCMEAKAYMDNK